MRDTPASISFSAGPARINETAAGLSKYLPGLFIVSLVIPIFIFLGPVRLSPYRILILVLLVPATLKWLSGRTYAFDYLIIGSILWAIIALAVNHPISAIVEPSGSLFIDAVGSYILARAYVDSADSFKRIVSAHLLVILVGLPFIIIETQTGRPPVLDFIRNFAPTLPDSPSEPRLGLERAQFVFDHAIVFGMFASSTIGIYLMYRHGQKSVSWRFKRVAVLIGATICSASTGPFLMIIIQCGLYGWNIVMNYMHVRKHWAILCGLVAFMYVFIDILSNRTPFHVFVSYLTLNSHTSYYRILIWNYGTENVANNPIFGIGFNDWERPVWMISSVDNFWLLMAMRYGLPTIIALILAVAMIYGRIARVRLLSDGTSSFRAGYLISLTALIVAGSTVHFWNASYSWFMFFLGSGVWLLKHDQVEFAGGVQGCPGQSNSDHVSRTAVMAPRRPRPAFGRDPDDGGKQTTRTSEISANPTARRPEPAMMPRGKSNRDRNRNR